MPLEKLDLIKMHYPGRCLLPHHIRNLASLPDNMTVGEFEMAIRNNCLSPFTPSLRELSQTIAKFDLAERAVIGVMDEGFPTHLSISYRNDWAGSSGNNYEEVVVDSAKRMETVVAKDRITMTATSTNDVHCTDIGKHGEGVHCMVREMRILTLAMQSVHAALYHIVPNALIQKEFIDDFKMQHNFLRWIYCVHNNVVSNQVDINKWQEIVGLVQMLDPKLSLTQIEITDSGQAFLAKTTPSVEIPTFFALQIEMNTSILLNNRNLIRDLLNVDPLPDNGEPIFAILPSTISPLISSSSAADFNNRETSKQFELLSEVANHLHEAHLQRHMQNVAKNTTSTINSWTNIMRELPEDNLLHLGWLVKKEDASYRRMQGDLGVFNRQRYNSHFSKVTSVNQVIDMLELLVTTYPQLLSDPKYRQLLLDFVQQFHPTPEYCKHAVAMANREWVPIWGGTQLHAVLSDSADHKVDFILNIKRKLESTEA